MEAKQQDRLVWYEDFKTGKMETGAGYNTEIVLDKKGEQYIAKIGRVYPDGTEDHPMKGTDLDRGSLTLTVDQLEPLTRYTFSAWARTEADTDTLWVGVFDAENEQYDIPKEIHEKVSSHEWKQVNVDLTTGPRTTEVAFFGLLASNTGPGYLKDLKVIKNRSGKKQDVSDKNIKDPVLTRKEDQSLFPITIPAIQKFIPTPDAGKWTPKHNGRIFIETGYKDTLTEEATLFVAELKSEHPESDYTVVYGTKNEAHHGDIFLEVGEIDYDHISEINSFSSEESYKIEIKEELLTLKSASARGIFYATRTILQALRTREALPGGTVIDWPQDQFRGLQVDTARRFFSINWLKEHIRKLAWMKMNVLHLRLKDAQGLRVESDVAPELVVPEHYTKEEIKDLVAYAERYHIMIIPEIDTPGHSGLDVRVYPEFGLKKTDGTVSPVLDYTKPEVRTYITKLVHEVCDLFKPAYIHLGGDEYEENETDSPQLLTWAKEQLGPKATWYDGYRLFFNELADTLRDKIVRPWIWNDMFKPGQGVLELDHYFIIDYWAKWDQAPIASEFHKAGYDTINKNSDWLYYDLWPNQIGGDDPRRFPIHLYEVWESSAYMKKPAWGKPVKRPQDDYTVYLNNPKHHLGALFAIWDDAHGWPSEKWVSKGMLSRFSAYAQKVWGSDNQIKDYAEFDHYIAPLAKLKD